MYLWNVFYIFSLPCRQKTKLLSCIHFVVACRSLCMGDTVSETMIVRIDPVFVADFFLLQVLMKYLPSS